MINIKEKLQPIWEQIVKIENRSGMDNIGTGLQDSFQESIRPLLPQGIGYVFEWNMSGQTKHIFYEIENTNNKLVF